MITKDLGAVTAYAYAVEGGYTGTEQEFTQLMADLGITVDEFEHFSVSVSTLPAGSSATASYSNGVLSLGIPKGDKGDTGNTGATGATPQLSIGTVETTAEPSVTITGTVDNPVLNFGLVKGDKGDTGEVSEAELTQAFEDFSANGTVANAEQLTTDIRANDQTPYLFRTSGGSVDIGDREYINGIVGGTVAWNQLIEYTEKGAYGTLTTARTSNGEYVVNGTTENAVSGGFGEALAQGHVYLFNSGTSNANIVLTNTDSWTSSMSVYIRKIAGTGKKAGFYFAAGTYNNEKFVPQLFDLTQMFGSTIADYIYSLEQATAGAGVAFFKSLFPKPYYAYNAGELKSVSGLVSHDMVGFNAFDGVFEQGTISTVDGSDASSTSNVRTKNYIRIVPSQTYHYRKESSSYGFYIYFYDADKNFLRLVDGNGIGGNFTANDNEQFIRIRFNGTGDISVLEAQKVCINLSWDGSRDGEYEPYELHSYPLDSDLTLRGIPKLDASNNLYYDGDTYESDGTVTRKYGIVDLGSLTWSYSTTWGTLPTFYALLGAKTLPNADTANWICSKYNTVSANALYIGIDKCIACNSGDIRITDSAYVDTTAFKTAMNGVYLVYELATPTTESADPYTSPQIVNDFGTEEYVLSVGAFPMPVGHDTDYPVDLKAKLEMAPNSPDQGNGDYIVRHTNGINEYVPLVIENVLPQAPNSNGTYSLTLTVANGEVTLSWT